MDNAHELGCTTYFWVEMHQYRAFHSPTSLIGNHLGLHVKEWCGLTFACTNWWLNVIPVEAEAVSDILYLLTDRPAVK
jgi:hypothetical protein